MDAGCHEECAEHPEDGCQGDGQGPIETTAPIKGTLPIAGYDQKSVGEIASRLETLTSDQLERLKDHERRNKNRETLIREIDRRIGATS